MKRKILFGILIIILVIGGLVLLHKKNEWKLSQEDLANYEAVYHEYPVVFLRNALDAYVGALDSKVVNDSCIMPPAIDPRNEKVDGDTSITTGLASFDPKYYESKFIVWSYDKNKENGNDIMILFRDKPDRLFYAWVGRDLEGQICLLGFNSTDNEKKVIEKIIKSLKPSIYDMKYGL